MAIIEETLILKIDRKITVSEIETFIKSNGIEPIRWAIIEKKDNQFKINVSGIKINN